MGLNTTSIQLLKLLATPHDYPPPRKWRGNYPWGWRSVYEGQGRVWGITYSGDIPEEQKPHITARDVLPLYDAGLLASDFPGTSAEKVSFHITAAGRRACGSAGDD